MVDVLVFLSEHRRRIEMGAIGAYALALALLATLLPPPAGGGNMHVVASSISPVLPTMQRFLLLLVLIMGAYWLALWSERRRLHIVAIAAYGGVYMGLFVGLLGLLVGIGTRL